MRKKRTFVDPHYAKSSEYEKVINRIKKEGICPFCPENFKYHKGGRKILRRSGNWILLKNAWPYKNTSLHLIAICETHKEKVQDVTAKDMAHILNLIKWAVQRFKIKGGGMAFRFGNTRYTGATVCHLHCHLIVPKLGKNKRAKVVSFPIG